jgi:predicted CXXCH cytochrome family protein
MKGLKVTLAVAASALLLAAPAMAFHDGGVAKCEGCHTMHNSVDGAAMGGGGKQTYANGTQFAAAGYLLQGNGSTSDACLVCHQADGDTGPSSYHISTVSTNLDPATNKWPLQMGPGGDFGWINLNTGSKYKRGHNVVAPTHNYTADGRFTALSPGGTYPAALFNCASCHDPHGKFRYVSDGTSYGPEVTTGAPIVESSSYPVGVVAANEAVGVYRILGGAGYSPKSIAGAHTFTDKAPIAVTTSGYNGSEATAQKVVAYGSNMSEWCANCHQALYENSYVSGEAGHTHPAGNGEKLDSFIVTAYNAYIASGNPVGAKGVAGYSTLVPFETGATMANRAALETDLAAGGPTAAATSNVSCLSCHRAHASGFNSMLRYDPASFMTVENAGATVYSAQADANSMLTAAYYGRPASSFIAYQRALCNKCHAKD